MQFYTSYSDAFHGAFAGQSYAVAHLTSIRLPMNIDTSGCYKVFFFLTGNKTFHIGKAMYDVDPGDLFVIHPGEWHYFSNIKEKESQERFVIFLYPDFLKQLSSEKTDLSSCFFHTQPIGKDGHSHRISLSYADREYLLSLFSKAVSYTGYGEDLRDLSVLLELLVFANQAYQATHQRTSGNGIGKLTSVPHGYSRQMSRLLGFLDEHFTEDLSLEDLSKQFFLSESYLCRIFKKETGTTIHKYVTARRITLAKQLLTQGYSVTEACTMSGFKDYNGFLKSFVTSVGTSPKKYAQLF